MAFLRIAKPEEVGTLRKLYIQLSVDLDRPQHHLESDCLLRPRPHRKPEPSFWAEHTMRLRKRPFRSGQMEESKIHGHRVKRGLGEWEVLGVTFPKVDRGMAPPRFSNHRRSKVDTNDLGSPFGCRRRRVPGAGRNIEQLHPASHTDSIEKRRGHLTGQGGKGIVVSLRDPLPTLVFKRAKRLGVNGRIGHLFPHGPPSSPARRLQPGANTEKACSHCSLRPVERHGILVEDLSRALLETRPGSRSHPHPET